MDASVTHGRGKKAITRGGGREGPEWEKGQVLCRGNRTKALRANRKNGNRQPREVGGWGNPPPRMHQNQGGERLSGLKGGTLNEMLYSGKREFVKSTHLQ